MKRKKLNTEEIFKHFAQTFPIDKLSKEEKKESLEYIAFRYEIENESDRGCALLAASYLEHLLEKVLKKKLIGTKKKKEELFDYTGPLGTFSSRIKLSYSIGLIPESESFDLHIIRSIRNKFGHSVLTSSFEDESIKKECDKLKTVRNNVISSRARFNSAVASTSATLIHEISNCKPFVKCSRLDIKSLNDRVEKAINLFANKKSN